jgi:uncharacterized membrane protein YfcA
MINFIYFFIVFFACTLGAVSGIGGGIIIKPIMDAIGALPVATINALSSITVLTMTTVSIIETRRNAKDIPWKIIFSFAAGSIIGGISGQRFLAAFLEHTANDIYVSIAQSGLQFGLTFLVIIYQLNRTRVRKYRVNNPLFMTLVGGVMGIIAAFLSIGGGLFNKPLLVILLSLSAKSAAYTSLCVIFFAQSANVITMGLTNHFAFVDVHVLVFMVAGAILGGSAGSYIATHVNEKYFERLFMFTLLVIFVLNGYNFFRCLLML